MRKILTVSAFLLLLLCGCQKETVTPNWAAAEKTASAPSADASGWQEKYDLGVRYLNDGNYEEAVIAFTAAIEIDPKNPDGYLRLADAYMGQGDTEAALRTLRDGIDQTGDERLIARNEEFGNEILSSKERIFERLALEEVSIEDFSCREAYEAAIECIEKQNYDAAAVWFYIAGKAERESRDDDGCTQDALAAYDAYLGVDDVAACMLVQAARSIDPEYDSTQKYNDMLSAIPDGACEKSGWIGTLTYLKMCNLEKAKQYGTLSIVSTPLRRWEESSFAPAEPLLPGQTTQELVWSDNGEYYHSLDGSWQERWLGGTIYEIRQMDLEGNEIVTTFKDGKPRTTEERDAMDRVHIRTNHRTDLCGIYWYAYAEYVPDFYPTSWESDRFTHQYWFGLDGMLSHEMFYNENGTYCIEILFYKNGEPSYRCIRSINDDGEYSDSGTYVNAKTGEIFDPDTDGYPE